MYQVPVPETEYEWVAWPLSRVTPGSTVTLDQDNPDASRKVTDNKTGPKWTTLLDADGIIVRAEPTSTISVRRPTEESSRAASKALTTNRVNERLRERHAEFKVNAGQLEVLAKLTEAAEQGYSPSSFTTSDLLVVQASDQVAARFDKMVAHALELDENADLQDILRRARDHFKDDIVRKMRGLSRSTSVVSNAMDDALLSATARFVDDAEYDV